MAQLQEGLKNTKFKDVEFCSTDIPEKVQRPGFYVDFKSNEVVMLNKFNKERNLEVKLYYFINNKDNSQIEVLELQEQLENIFLYHVKINEDFYMNVKGVYFFVNKKSSYLVMRMKLYSLERIEDDFDPNEGYEISINTDIRRG